MDKSKSTMRKQNRKGTPSLRSATKKSVTASRKARYKSNMSLVHVIRKYLT